MNLYLFSKKNNNLFSTSYIMMILAVFLSGYVSIFDIKLRLEDLLAYFILFLYFVFFVSKKQKMNNKISKFHFIQILVLLMGTLTSLLFFSLKLLNLAAFLLISKIIVYVVISISTYYFISVKENNYFFLMRIIEKLFIANIIYSIFNLIQGDFVFYGVGNITESAPSQTGTFYFFSTLFFFLNLSKRRYISKVLFIISLILLFATVSRTAIFAIFVALSMYFMFYLPMKHKIKSLIIITPIFFVLPFTLNIDFSLIYKITSRLNSLVSGDALLIRLEHWSGWTSHFPPFQWFNYLIGFGYFASNFFSGKRPYTLDADNFYIRIFYETGIIGLILWIYLFFKLYSFFIPKKSNIAIFSVLCLTGIICICFTHEILYLAKPAEIFFTIILANYAYLKKWQKEQKIEKRGYLIESN